MRTKEAGAVLYNWNTTGYRVLLVRNGRVIDEYSAGGNPFDSQAPGDQCKGRWARETAFDIAREHGISRRRVSHDSEIEV